MRRNIGLCILFISLVGFFGAFLHGGAFCKTAEADVSTVTADVSTSVLDKVRLPVLMYHNTFAKNVGTYNVSPSCFEQDLIYLKSQGYEAIVVQDLLDYKAGKKDLPKKPIILTFDDGYLANYLYMFPILKKHDVKIVMFVVGSFIEGNYIEGGLKHAHVDYEQIKKMHDSGLVEIQNHTFDLHKISNGKNGMKKMNGESFEAYKARLSADLFKLNKKLADKTGVNCNAVAYPFGAYSKETVKVLEQIGIQVSFSCTQGTNLLDRNSSLQELKRYNRTGTQSTESFFAKIF